MPGRAGLGPSPGCGAGCGRRDRASSRVLPRAVRPGLAARPIGPSSPRSILRSTARPARARPRGASGRRGGPISRAVIGGWHRPEARRAPRRWRAGPPPATAERGPRRGPGSPARGSVPGASRGGRGAAGAPRSGRAWGRIAPTTAARAVRSVGSVSSSRASSSLRLLRGLDQRAEPLDAPRQLHGRAEPQRGRPRRVEHDVGQAALRGGVGHVAQRRRGGQAGRRRVQRDRQRGLGAGRGRPRTGCPAARPAAPAARPRRGRSRRAPRRRAATASRRAAARGWPRPGA